jgi:glycosyltransferase involved in cell wall biosynthesis
MRRSRNTGFRSSSGRTVEYRSHAIISGKKIVVVLPAFNAVLVDDCSSGDTVEIAKRYGLDVTRHDRNHCYGANQRTCYRPAYELGATIVVMLHPDNQYTRPFGERSRSSPSGYP